MMQYKIKLGLVVIAVVSIAYFVYHDRSLTDNKIVLEVEKATHDQVVKEKLVNLDSQEEQPGPKHQTQDLPQEQLSELTQVSQSDCRIPTLATGEIESPSKYTDALLWEVSKDGKLSNYIFGTIHVSDPKIVNIPEQVNASLNAADVFVMEALPVPEEAMKFSQMMFFSDGRTLKDFIDDGLFDKTAKILREHKLNPETVILMKPWAAFLMMNYPINQGPILDLQLLKQAEKNGAEIHGLESLSEQGSIFSDMKMYEQVQLLLDTVCNYEMVSNDFEKMKSLYLKRDLKGLFLQSNKYSFNEEPVYQDLMKRLLVDRNYLMAERMQSVLEKGNAFIAIGAMHLPGEEGVLSLLDKQGYTINSIY